MVRWLRGSRGAPRERLRAGTISDLERIPRRGGDRLQDVRQGVGPAFQRRYTVRIAGSAMDARRLMDELCGDLNAASPVEFAVFDKLAGSSPHLAVGDEYAVHMPGPWDCPVRVVERTPMSFRLATLEGHVEAGEIEFRTADAEDGDLVFTIESWTRSGDRLADVLYDRLHMAKEMQRHMWTHFCSRVAELSGGRMAGEVEVYTDRAEVAGRDGRVTARYLTQAATAVFTTAFTTMAKLRDGRPLHPSGLVLDATLRTKGTSRFWGVSLLDDPAELRGVARLSRAIGLPSPLPDLLGLALRWQQPDADATAELLLATTGRSVPGRHLLRPATRWSPGFYGSLLPYTAGDRRVLLGAVTRQPRTIPADPSALSRAVNERPLQLDLLVATEFGSWEHFGELLLTGPVRSDESEPVRFNPVRHPICGLSPAGPFQQIRGATYGAVQQTDPTT